MPSTTPYVTKGEQEPHTLIARLILGGVGVLFVAHLSLFAFYTPPSSLEGIIGFHASPSPLFDLLLAGWKAVFGSSMIATRMFSVACSVGAFYLIYRAAQRWSNDQPIGAALTLGLILFPTTALAFAQAIPIALIALLAVATVMLLTSTQKSSARQKMVMVAVLCAVIGYLHPVGVGLALVLIMLGLAHWGLSSRTAPFVVAVPFVVGVMSFLFPLPVSITQLGQALSLGWGQALVTQILQPYAMLWVAILFSIMALVCSRPLRIILGREGMRRSVAMLSVLGVTTIWVALIGGTSQRESQIVFSAIVPVGVLAALPMVMWIRLVMPQLRSIFIWILLPVIMYSCFWVVLGPIDLNGFPYDQLTQGHPFSSAQPPG